jgi:Protein of unknown function (DUF2970)
LIDPIKQKASLLQVVRMVLSAFLGIRKRADHDQLEVAPWQVIVIAIIAGLSFVLTVVTVVRLVLR